MTAGLKLKRELEAGWFQWVEMPLPAVLTIQSGINKPRYATLKGIMAAKKKEIATVDRNSLGVADAPTQHIERIYVPQKTKKTEFITGTPKEIAAKLIGKIQARGARPTASRMKILLITEQRDGKWNNVSFETLAAAQQIVQQTKGSTSGGGYRQRCRALADDLPPFSLMKFCWSSTICSTIHAGRFQHRSAPSDRMRQA